tara:strand:+ start:411 stop:761 length:351 start_codon:yes stop_codon:yes gene_type:complete
MKMIDLMDGYLREKSLLVENTVSTSELPIKKQRISDWQTREDPQRYYKKIKFKNHERFVNFIIALLQYEDTVKHNAKITIGYPDVILEVWTHRFEGITDMDREYCREVDSILQEIV